MESDQTDPSTVGEAGSRRLSVFVLQLQRWWQSFILPIPFSSFSLGKYTSLHFTSLHFPHPRLLTHWTFSYLLLGLSLSASGRLIFHPFFFCFSRETDDIFLVWDIMLLKTQGVGRVVDLASLLYKPAFFFRGHLLVPSLPHRWLSRSW